MRNAAPAQIPVVWLALLFAYGLPQTGQAHPAYLTAGEVSIARDGRFRATVRFDTLAFALNDTSARIGNAPMEELLTGPADVLQARLNEAKDRFLHGFHVETDAGPGLIGAAIFPAASDVQSWRASAPRPLPVVLPVELAGRLPEAASTVAFRFPSVLDQVILTVERPGEEAVAEPVDSGALSIVLPLRLTPSVPTAPVARARAPYQFTLYIMLFAALFLGVTVRVRRWRG